MEFKTELALTSPEEFVDDPPTRAIIGRAVKVHRALGPGLLESAYQACLCHELARNGLDCGYRIDVLVNGEIVVEIKCVEALLPIHEAQLLTYLKLSGRSRGLLLNFNVALLKNGILRRVLSRHRPPVSG